DVQSFPTRRSSDLMVAEGATALPAGSAVERDAELDGLLLIVAAPAGVDGPEQYDRGRAERGCNMAWAAIGGDHESAAADDRFGSSEAHVFVGQAANLWMVSGCFNRGGAVAFLRTAEHECREAKFVGSPKS